MRAWEKYIKRIGIARRLTPQDKLRIKVIESLLQASPGALKTTTILLKQAKVMR